MDPDGHVWQDQGPYDLKINSCAPYSDVPTLIEMPYLLPHPTGPMTPVSFPVGKWALIFLSEASGAPGYAAVKFFILCSVIGLMSDLKALFSRSGLVAVGVFSGRRRISSIRVQALRSSANKVANMKMNRRLSSTGIKRTKQ